MTHRIQRVTAACLAAAMAMAPVPALAQAPGVIPPPPPPAAEAAEWYVSISGGATQGPFALSRLKEMAASGELKPSDQVYSAKSGWKAASDIPGLTFAAPPAPPPPPAPPGPPAPPTRNTQQDLDARLQSFIVGTWHYEGTISQGGYSAYIVVEATYRPDGSVAGYTSMQLPAYNGVSMPPSVTELRGRYTLTAIDETNFTLTTMLQDGRSQTGKLKIVDRNTLENTADGGISRRIR